MTASRGDASGRSPTTVVCHERDVPADGCLAVADDTVLLARTEGRIVAYRNRCLHKQARLDDGTVRDGTLTCAQHFWRYRLSDGRKVGSPRGLEPVPVAVVEGEVRIAPLPPAPTSVRALLLEHARTWTREGGQ
jgi:nitrite reductase/ring-hydroxylating ferredoxin subunit